MRFFVTATVAVVLLFGTSLFAQKQKDASQKGDAAQKAGAEQKGEAAQKGDQFARIRHGLACQVDALLPGGAVLLGSASSFSTDATARKDRYREFHSPGRLFLLLIRRKVEQTRGILEAGTVGFKV